MKSATYVLIFVLGFFAIGLSIYFLTNKSREGFKEMYDTNMYDRGTRVAGSDYNSIPAEERRFLSDDGVRELLLGGVENDVNMIQRPTFKPALSPRFDPYRTGTGMTKGTKTDLNMQAAPIDPLLNSATDFASMGAMQKEDAQNVTGCKLSGLTDSAEKFRRGLDYTQPAELLPTPDMRSCFKDPSNPDNYMYDRTIFAKLKGRHWRGGVDYIRGDIYITPRRTGWFDSPAIPHIDLYQGAISMNAISGGTSLENVTDIQDFYYGEYTNPKQKSLDAKLYAATGDNPWASASNPLSATARLP